MKSFLINVPAQLPRVVQYLKSDHEFDFQHCGAMSM